MNASEFITGRVLGYPYVAANLKQDVQRAMTLPMMLASYLDYGLEAAAISSEAAFGKAAQSDADLFYFVDDMFANPMVFICINKTPHTLDELMLTIEDAIQHYLEKDNAKAN